MRHVTSILLAATVTASIGCGAAAITGPTVPTAAITRCRIGASQSSLLVTEWSGADKANLEAAVVGGGGVAVAFSGCELRLVPACRLRGSYAWQPTTAATDYLAIENQAQLYAKLPLGALALEGELARAGSLTMSTTVAGQRRAVDVHAADVLADPSCHDATHVIDAVSLGAFVLSAGGDESSQLSADVRLVGTASGQMSTRTRVVRSAGDSATCSTATAAAPAGNCASPVQVFLTPVPGRAETAGPPGTVRADFVSASEDARWDVYVDDRATCTTPCSVWVDPSRPLAMRTREDRPQTVAVRRIPTDRGPLQIEATPRRNLQFLTGLTFTSFGGIAVVAGVSLAGVGCSGDNDTMCEAGIISGLAGAAVTAGAVWLLRRSFADVHVRPVFDGAR